MYGYPTVCLAVYPLIDIWVVSIFGAIVNSAAIDISV